MEAIVIGLADNIEAPGVGQQAVIYEANYSLIVSETYSYSKVWHLTSGWALSYC
jgi:hypothetical protein